MAILLTLGDIFPYNVISENLKYNHLIVVEVRLYHDTSNKNFNFGKHKCKT